MIWHIRPYDEQATYGTQDGQSYTNAFNGLAKINGNTGPAAGAIQPGDHVYVYGRHKNQANHNRFYSHVAGCTVEGVACHLESQWHIGYMADLSGITLRSITTEGDRVYRGGHSIVVEDCTFLGGHGVNWYKANDNSIVRRCRFFDTKEGVYLSNKDHNNVQQDRSANNVLIEGNLFRDVGAGWSYGDGHAVGIQASSEVIVRNNYCQDCRGTAIECWLSTVGQQHRIKILHNTINGTINDGRNSLLRGIGFSSGNNNVEGRRKGCVVAGNRIRNTAGDGIGWNCPDQGAITGNEVLNAGRHSFFEYQPGATPVIPHGNTFLESSQSPVSIKYGPNFDLTAEAPDNLFG